MKPAKPKPIPEIIRAAIERVTGDPHQARREVVQAIIDDLAVAGLTVVAAPLPGRRKLQAHDAGDDRAKAHKTQR